MATAIGGARACGICVASALLLGACASNGDGSAVLGNLLAYNSVNAPPTKPLDTPIRVDCPEVSVADSGASVRVYSGASHSNESVRYQYDIGQLARQCSVVDGQISIKVGVAGRVLIGPAGSAGDFTVPIRVSIRRLSDDKTLVSQVYRTQVDVPHGSGQSLFTTVSQPLSVPYTRVEADRDYHISVGFDQPGAKAPRRRARRRRG
ncbi:MAG TPA: hypothetical protein VND97_05940 [Beijerinckiaceae bacterium]|nr:hypothetical protein [Beijerinckiaceae bacterium]